MLLNLNNQQPTTTIEVRSVTIGTPFGELYVSVSNYGVANLLLNDDDLITWAEANKDEIQKLLNMPLVLHRGLFDD